MLLGGVMNFQTLQPEYGRDGNPLSSGRALARYASANQEKTTHLDLKLGSEKWASVSSFSFNAYGDLRMGRHGPEAYLRHTYLQRQNGQDVVIQNPDPLVQRPSEYEQINLMQKLAFRPSRELEVIYGLHHSATTSYARYDRLLQQRNGLPRSGSWRYGPQVWTMNQLSLVHRGGASLYDELNLRLAYQRFEESRIDRDFNDPLERTRTEQVDAYSVNLDVRKEWNAKNRLYYGLEAVVNDVRSRGEAVKLDGGEARRVAARYPQADWQSYALYALYEHALGHNLRGQAGLRYNHFLLNARFDTTFFDLPFAQARLEKGALIGNLGLVYSPDPSWVLSTNASTGFRAPNVDDVGKVFDSEPGAVVVPNPDLQAEYAYNLEVGLAKIWGKRLKVDVTAFYTLLGDALVRRPFSLNGRDSIVYDGGPSRVDAIQNAAKARVWGIQANLEIKLPSGFSLNTQLNYQRGEEELDDGSLSPSRHVAPFFGQARIAYHKSRLRMSLYAHMNGAISHENLALEERGKPHLYASDEQGLPYAPAWYTLNLKAQYRLEGPWTLSAGVENLTDQRYRPYSSGLAGAGRNVILSLQAEF